MNRSVTLLCILALLLAALPHPVRAAELFDGYTLALKSIENDTCALTFDDGPGPYTARLLDILRDRNIKATFFLQGVNVALRPQIVRRIAAEGHEIGNHTYTHASLRHMPIEQQREEVRRTSAAIQELGGTVRFLRTPYGRYDKNTLAVAAEEGLAVIMWSVDSRDWQRGGGSTQLAVPGLAKGKTRGVFLFHDTHSYTVDRMPATIERLQATGCRFVTMSEFLSPSGPVCAESPSPAPAATTQ